MALMTCKCFAQLPTVPPDRAAASTCWVTFQSAHSLGHTMDLKLALEDLFSVPVDRMTRRGLRAELRERIEDKAIPLA